MNPILASVFLVTHLTLWQWMEEIAQQALSGDEETMCLKCKHYNRSYQTVLLTCTAFPDGIPGEIIFGIIPHDCPFPGDNGIMFEPVTPVDPDSDKRSS